MFLLQKCLYSLATSLEARCLRSPEVPPRGQMSRDLTRDRQLSRGLRLLWDQMKNVRSLMGIRDLMADLRQLLPAQLGTPPLVAAGLARLVHNTVQSSKSTRAMTTTTELYASMGPGSFQRSRDIYSLYGGPSLQQQLPKPPPTYAGARAPLPKPPRTGLTGRRNRSIEPLPPPRLPQPPTYATASRHMDANRPPRCLPPLRQPGLAERRNTTTLNFGGGVSQRQPGVSLQPPGGRWIVTRSSTPRKPLAGEYEKTRYFILFFSSSHFCIFVLNFCHSIKPTMTSNLSIFFVSFFCQFFFSFVAEDRNLSATVCRPQLRWTSGDRIQNCANVLRDERVFFKLCKRFER